jgi:hypothetical protein
MILRIRWLVYPQVSVCLRLEVTDCTINVHLASLFTGMEAMQRTFAREGVTSTTSGPTLIIVKCRMARSTVGVQGPVVDPHIRVT